MAKKSATNLLEQIEASKSRDLSNLDLRPGHSSRWGTNCRDPCPAFWLTRTIWRRRSVEELDDIPEIGLTVAESVRDWFDDEGNLKLCDRLRAAGVKTEVRNVKRLRPLMSDSPESSLS